MSTSIRLPRAAVRAGVRATRPLLSPWVPVPAQRAGVELIARLSPVPADTVVTSAPIGGVPADRLTPAGRAGDAVVLYLHGGGYVFGSPRSHRALAARIAGRAGAVAIVPDYRRAPEDRHPAALQDVLAVYSALVEDGVAPERIALAGDSAGGGLALATALALRDAGEPLPAAIGLICPWLDLGPDATGDRPATGDVQLSTAALRGFARAYLDGAAATDPAVSPLHADLAGLPPLVVHSAGDDPLAPDAARLAERARRAGVSVEERRHPGLWHDFHMTAGALAAADDAVAAFGDALRAQVQPAPRPLRVAVAGGGMSGLCMGAKLREAGIEDFTIYEKAAEVGGTWRENTYPGLTCDVPAHYYAYSFAPNPDWSSSFAPGPEIQAYFRRVTDDLGLRAHVRQGSEVTSARWEDGRWSLEIAGGGEDRVDVLVTATGVLHHPNLPDIPGLERFAGAMFHSARWDHDVPLDGRRIAVVGTGSTGAQIVTALARRAGSLSLFQRTPQWIAPVPNVRYPEAVRGALRRVPALNRLAYLLHQRAMEAILSPAVTRPGWQRRAVSASCRLNLRLVVRDRALRARLTPSYEPMCKRLVMSSGFYPAMQRPGVELVTEAIDHVEERGIVTRDGRMHEIDVLVLATGFDAHAYMRPMEVVGEGGLTLERAWRDGPRAYRTVALPGFPNLFTLMGPHSPIGNHSLIAVAETQADWMLRWIERMRSGEIASVAPTPEATARFNADLRAAMPGTIWTTGCDSWYLGPDGTPELWPWSPGRHRAMLREPEPGDFAIDARAR